MAGFKLDIDRLHDGEYYWYETGFGWEVGRIHVDLEDGEAWMEVMGSDSVYRDFRHVIGFDYEPVERRYRN